MTPLRPASAPTNPTPSRPHKSAQRLAYLAHCLTDRCRQRDPHSSGGVRHCRAEGHGGVDELLNVIAYPDDERIPEIARESLPALGDQLQRLAWQVTGAPIDESGCDCARQPARAHGLGNDGQGRTLPGTDRAGSIEAAPRTRSCRQRHETVGKAVMQNWSIR